MVARTLMVQGTASSVGKSALVTALCRIFRQDGLRVAPFKSQNMALNSAVTVDGGEIGRAQAEQAAAAGIEPTVDMNPILLKPEGEMRSQVVVRGRPWATLSAWEYQQRKAELLGVVAESLARLRAAYDLVIIEGAGSPAEINLKADEIVNMRVAALADAPVLLVGDIDRGGVFASLLGTLELLEPDERARIAGLVINKFRGDRRLLQPGLEVLEARTGKPVLGVIPYLPNIGLAEEDSATLEDRPAAAADGRVEIAVIRLPRLSNYDDFDPLAAEAAVRFVDQPRHLGEPDLIIVPGTKSTAADLAWLRASGLAAAIVEHVERGVPLLGICGGYQMLGRQILDPDRVEAEATTTPGLGLLDVVTEFLPEKQTVRVEGVVEGGAGPFAALQGKRFRGYEIHHGRTRRGAEMSWLRLEQRSGHRVDDVDGALRQDGLVAGCYIHGFFDADELRAALLEALARRRGRAVVSRPFSRQHAFDRLADHVRRHLDLAALRRIIGLSSD
ncbi:MAG: cobyric acid synthase [Chloroflexota bacterium]|nr:cobyric acid synthase [Dehalococcoidia bacterium]MDW8255035.1 cobyric acid synthase [Chloroflexota bacterium]